MKKILTLFVAVLFLGVSSCGTLLKDGKGGKSGQLDIKIVLLDAVGLLFFLVPGVIAFAVDFNNNTIYK
jgi:hypothetical protein